MAEVSPAVPLPATIVPPSVNDSGSIGTMQTQFALANHTHASKVRKNRKTGVTTATYVWAYDTPFTNGIIPAISAIVEDPSNTATDSYNVQVIGTPSATQTTFRVIRTSSGLFGLLTGALGINPVPGNVNLHLIALEP